MPQAADLEKQTGKLLTDRDACRAQQQSNAAAAEAAHRAAAQELGACLEAGAAQGEELGHCKEEVGRSSSGRGRAALFGPGALAPAQTLLVGEGRRAALLGLVP